MGSFTSMPKVAGSDKQDDDLEFPKTTVQELLKRCQIQLGDLPRPFDRKITWSTGKLDSSDTFRVLQWNQLSQTLGTKKDRFVQCSPATLDWSSRRWRLIEELIRYDPDIICLQEVDHFKLLEKALGSVGYKGRFVPKPDSPCIYLDSNNGPDGCAIFYKNERFELISEASKVLEVWWIQSNQVVLGVNMRERKSGKEICIATTHLKARSGTLLPYIRNEQGKDMFEWLEVFSEERPLILSGDFNAEPSEPVYDTIANKLHTAYNLMGNESKNILKYTTWKIRETGEQKNILDYIFHSRQLETVTTLDMPTEEQIGEDRLPSLQFASDHLSLVAELRFKQSSNPEKEANS